MWFVKMIAVDLVVLVTIAVICTIYRLRCRHQAVRCIHGEEAIEKGHNLECLLCGKTLMGDATFLCFYTGQPHEDEK